MEPAVAKSVKKFVKARFKRGMPLEKLEKTRFEEVSEEDEENAKRLWEEFRVGLKIDPVSCSLMTVVGTFVLIYPCASLCGVKL